MRLLLRGDGLIMALMGLWGRVAGDAGGEVAIVKGELGTQEAAGR